MKKLILASVSAIALFGVAACSDSTDNTTTQSTPPAADEGATPPAAAPMEPAPADGAMEPAPATPPAQ